MRILQNCVIPVTYRFTIDTVCIIFIIIFVIINIYVIVCQLKNMKDDKRNGQPYYYDCFVLLSVRS